VSAAWWIRNPPILGKKRRPLRGTRLIVGKRAQNKKGATALTLSGNRAKKDGKTCPRCDGRRGKNGRKQKVRNQLGPQKRGTRLDGMGQKRQTQSGLVHPERKMNGESQYPGSNVEGPRKMRTNTPGSVSCPTRDPKKKDRQHAETSDQLEGTRGGPSFMGNSERRKGEPTIKV